MTTLSLASVLAESARRTPEKTAVVQSDTRVSYADLWREDLCLTAGEIIEAAVGPMVPTDPV